MEKSALEGMLDLLVRKGKLRYSDLGQVPQEGSCAGGHAWPAESGQLSLCGKMPHVYEMVGRSTKK